MPESVSRARHHTTATLAAWNLATLADTAELIVSELVTNALKASWQSALVLPVMMRLRTDGRSLLIECWDTAATPPQPRTHAPDGIGGRGLELVAALSDGWGYHLENGGKVVWSLITAP